MTATIELTGAVEMKWHVVKLADGQTFELATKTPEFAERLKSSELAGRLADDGRWLQHRVESTVFTWSGLDLGDADDASEFTHAKLAQLCDQFPELYAQVMTLVHNAWKVAEITAADAGN